MGPKGQHYGPYYGPKAHTVGLASGAGLGPDSITTGGAPQLAASRRAVKEGHSAHILVKRGGKLNKKENYLNSLVYSGKSLIK